MMKMLMVCLGNICRSPLAEAVLQHLANKHELNWVVHSAGTNGLHNGEAPHVYTQKIALKHGIDMSLQVSKKMLATDISKYDKIYVMADDVMENVKKLTGSNFETHKVHYFLNEWPHHNYGNNVPDPWYGNEAGFETVHTLITQTCQAIIDKHKTQ